MIASKTTQRAFHALRRHHNHHTITMAFIPLTPLTTLSTRTCTCTSFTINLPRNRHQFSTATTPKSKRPSNLPGRPGSGRVISMASVDLKFIRDNADMIRQNVINRSVSADVDIVISLYDKLVSLTMEADSIRSKRNLNASLMKSAGKMSVEERKKCIQEGKELKLELSKLEDLLTEIEKDLSIEASKIPNLTHPSSPIGNESEAAVLSNVGEQRDFTGIDGDICRSHVDLLQMNDWADFENASRIAGNKFYYLKNEAAMLELALISWSMSIARKNNFTLLTTPDVAREDIVSGCGFQPRGESSQVYRIADTDLCLIGTSEIPLGGYYSGQILTKEQLPIRMAAFSHCFRREVGSSGTIAKGLYRVHQFSKVELFVISHPDQSDQIHNELKELEENMYSSLGLCFKTLDMPSEDLGNPAYRKFDIEAWMPGRGCYGEISSASNCTDYQARRLGIRYREDKGVTGDNRYVHTLNATACAVPRMIISIIESHQRPDGSVVIPEVLRPFMGGMESIGGGERAAEFIACEKTSSPSEAVTSASS